jgi:hypothetical protein
MHLSRSHTLPNGLRVRLRLPHAGDHRALRALHEGRELAATPLELRRALRHDPRDHVAVCATGWVGRQERLVGFAAADVHGAEPVLLLADEDVAPDVSELLLAALADCGVTGLGTIPGLRVA